MNSYELEQALACKQMEVEDLRRQVAEQAEAIDLQLHTNRRIAELEEKVAKWVEKAKNWTASPEAGKQLAGYRAMGAKCAVLEAECDELSQQLAGMKIVAWTNEVELDYLSYKKADGSSPQGAMWPDERKESAIPLYTKEN